MSDRWNLRTPPSNKTTWAVVGWIAVTMAVTGCQTSPLSNVSSALHSVPGLGWLGARDPNPPNLTLNEPAIDYPAPSAAAVPTPVTNSSALAATPAETAPTTRTQTTSTPPNAMRPEEGEPQFATAPSDYPTTTYPEFPPAARAEAAATGGATSTTDPAQSLTASQTDAATGATSSYIQQGRYTSGLPMPSTPNAAQQPIATSPPPTTNAASPGPVAGGDFSPPPAGPSLDFGPLASGSASRNQGDFIATTPYNLEMSSPGAGAVSPASPPAAASQNAFASHGDPVQDHSHYQRSHDQGVGPWRPGSTRSLDPSAFTGPIVPQAFPLDATSDPPPVSAASERHNDWQ